MHKTFFMKATLIALFISLLAPVSVSYAAEKKTVKKSAQKSPAKAKAKRVNTVKSLKRISVPAIPSTATLLGLHQQTDVIGLSSAAAMIIELPNATASLPGSAVFSGKQDPSGAPGYSILFSKNAKATLPIASITKLMSAMVLLDARLDLNANVSISSADADTLKNTNSRLPFGSHFTRYELLHLALMSSENRAISALARTYPGGSGLFIQAMNAKAKQLGLMQTRYVDASGLSPENVSSAGDLALLMTAASQYPLIRELSTDLSFDQTVGSKKVLYKNSNRLLRDETDTWDIVAQKTGYIMEAGHCLVMHTRLQNRSIIMVFLDAQGAKDRFDDAKRVRSWLSSSVAKEANLPVNEKDPSLRFALHP